MAYTIIYICIYIRVGHLFVEIKLFNSSIFSVYNNQAKYLNETSSLLKYMTDFLFSMHINY